MDSSLLGKRWNRISRAAGMLCVLLGEDYSFQGARGKQLDVAEFAIHMQASWRLIKKGEILLESADLYEPYDEPAIGEIIANAGKRRCAFDVRAEAVTELMQGARVLFLHRSSENRLTVVFSNGVVLEQVLSASGEEEEWRLIDFCRHIHFVCRGGKLSME